MEKPDFVHVYTSSLKLKVDQKFFVWAWSVWSQESEIDCISRMNKWNELVFCMLVQIHIAKLFQ